MIALAVCWLVLFRASAAAGDLILRGLGAPPSEEDHWFVSFWVGLLTLASAVLAVVPFAPAYYAAPVLLIGLYPKTPAPPAGFWLVAGAMTYVSSSPVRLYDTTLYHQPAIEWMSAQGLVPGLALVQFRFGFTSSWLALTSLFSVGPMQTRASVVVTGLVLTIMLVQWIQFYHQNNSIEKRYYLFGLPLLLLLFFLDSAIVSPSPNLGAGLAVFTGIWMLLRLPGHAAAFLTAAGAMAIKLSAVPLLLVALVRAPKRVGLLAAGAALVAPFVFANYWTTGCPLFPAPLACVESPSSLTANHVRVIAHDTLNWARYAGPYPAGVEYFSLDWVSKNLAPRQNAIVAMLVLASLAVIMIRRQFSAATAAAILGSAYVYAAAPDPRFGAGFLFALPALALPALRLPGLPREMLTMVVSGVLVVGAMAGEWISNRNSPDSRYRVTVMRALVPAVAWTPGALAPFEHNGVRFYRPEATERCGAAPLPCAPYPLEPTLRRCGRGWCRDAKVAF